ncbi:hypothetical protein FLONG3_9501 [Fusarium longipes]|uniref:Uncharacterized protein n=1 Tax=Fusarium longipes TaxID=694270 RepID=A0A395RWE4_9HYPO|nr:hypothetical protein FLONG3_9501 [Fusarium longipes]
MKFSVLFQTLLAVPALTAAVGPSAVDAAEVTKREACKLTLQWKSNWRESGLRRYRVQLITSPRDDTHLTLFCNHLRRGQAQHNNQQCYWRDGMFVVDLSHADGPAGYASYKRDFNNAADTFEWGTGCKVVRNL